MRIDAGEVELRDYEHADRMALLEMLADPELMALALVEHPLSQDEADRLIEASFKDTTGPHLGTVCLATTGEVVGFSGFRPCEYLGPEDTEFGWVIRQAYQGRGYATELGRAQIKYALTTLGLKRVLAACNPDNGASDHVLRNKLGMHFEGVVETRPGFFRNVYSADEPLP